MRGGAYKAVDGEAERKAGPVEIGRKRQESFQAAKYKLPSDTDFLGERGLAKLSEGEVEKKEGPLAMGRIRDYSVAKFEIAESAGITGKRGLKKAGNFKHIIDNSFFSLKSAC